LVNPELSLCDTLRSWYENIDKDEGGMPSDLCNVMEFENIGLEDANERVSQGETIYCNTTVTITYINDEYMSYTSCGYCNKSIATGLCEKHGDKYGTPRNRYMLQVHLEQDGYEMVVAAFDDVGKKLFSKEVSALIALKTNEPQAFDEVFQNIVERVYRIRLSFSSEQKQGSTEVKCTILHVEQIEK